jgi:hypothetical protein
MSMLYLLKEECNVICLTECHLTDYEMDAIHILKYKLGARYCRKKLKMVVPAYLFNII